MKCLDIDYVYNDKLNAYFLEFGDVANCIINVEDKRCFITNFDYKHNLENSMILTSVKDRTLKEDRLLTVYFRIKDQLAEKNAKMNLDEEQFVQYMLRLLKK